MTQRNDDLGWRVPAGFAAVAVAALLLSRIWPDYSTICRDGEGGAICAREWIGAASGWMAAIAAAIAVRPLLGQLREQRRQTEFALGYAPATLSAAHVINSLEDAVLHVVNWNRFPSDVLAVRMDENQFAAGMAMSKVSISGTPVERDTRMGTLKGIVRIPGWEDRNGPPPFADVTVYITFHNDAPEIVPVEFEVELIVYAEAPYRTTLRASMNIRANDF
ncbi:hypothetical protein FJW04_21945 [Mesorhizobium sp. B2-7-3]|uniref:hypothetical protein n=1 Tax=unclassified Mesorhizobium TaxID=325217 RepID=UPI001129A428|nr:MULTISPECIES: hypothetical protein [unclassified Mesorhizobium]MBZ9927763.1 hypothetical protein [Mesorhizobium sp. BR1-1-4]TPJ12922.1 hypothetical protein FJW04_21945 [Mesorhizobium sp. B2-7-3]